MQRINGLPSFIWINCLHTHTHTHTNLARVDNLTIIYLFHEYQYQLSHDLSIFVSWNISNITQFAIQTLIMHTYLTNDYCNTHIISLNHKDSSLVAEVTTYKIIIIIYQKVIIIKHWMQNINLLMSNGQFHLCKLDESIYHSSDTRFMYINCCKYYAKSEDPDQKPHFWSRSALLAYVLFMGC